MNEFYESISLMNIVNNKDVSEKPIKRVCAWCNKVMAEGEEPPTHGICHKCGKKLMEDYERATKSLSAGGTPQSL